MYKKSYSCIDRSTHCVASFVSSKMSASLTQNKKQSMQIDLALQRDLILKGEAGVAATIPDRFTSDQ